MKISLNKKSNKHYQNLIYSANFLKFIYKNYLEKGELSTEKIYALSKLTWYSPGWKRWKTEAIRVIMGLKRTNNNKNDDIANDVQKYFKFNPGIVNYYKVYRGTTKKWLNNNRDEITRLIRKAARLKADIGARNIIKIIDKLPRIPNPSKTAYLHPKSLLTPIVALLDPRVRFPIINQAWHVEELHRNLGIKGATLLEKFDTLVKQINQHGIKDALMLDALTDEISGLYKKPQHRRKNKKTKNDEPKKLGKKKEDDYVFFQRQKSVKVKQIHDKITNLLKDYCKKRGFEVFEGRETNKYDALIKNYYGKRDLLIEVKTSTGIDYVRHAIGQLFDYRRGLDRRPVTDLAILLPQKPSDEIIDLLNDIGIYLLWLKSLRKCKIDGNLKALVKGKP